MLTLTRKTGEEIVIDERTIVRVLETRKGRVRLGVIASPKIPIRRGELPSRGPDDRPAA